KRAFPSAQGNIRILLAEDHQPNILVATSYLDGMGYGYDIARTGKEVIAKLTDSDRRYDLVLMDVQMPELDGCTATQLLRKLERKRGGGRLPVIGLTAHVLPEQIKKCIEAGMDDYIAKPFDLGVLQKKIAALIG